MTNLMIEYWSLQRRVIFFYFALRRFGSCAINRISERAPEKFWTETKPNQTDELFLSSRGGDGGGVVVVVLLLMMGMPLM